MIVVTARVRTSADKADALVAHTQVMCRASREELGCIGYRFYADTEQPLHYVIVEEWRDDAALQKHFTEPHTAMFMAGIPDLIEGPADALFHTVASTRRLGPAGLEDA